MTKTKIPLSVRLPRRLYKIIMDIRPLFIDTDDRDPMRGATTRALSYILQYYMESEDYRNKLVAQQEFAKKLFHYMCEKDREEIADFVKMILEKED